MSASKRILTCVVAALALMVLLPSTPASALCYSSNSNEKSFHKKLNGARNGNGRSSLILDPELSKAAKRHTFEMVNKDLLYHTPTNALKKRVTGWSELGENVGVGGTVDSLHSAFMNSPAHKANIMYSRFKYVGIGSKKANGRLWVTFIFEATANPGSPLC